MIKKNRNADLRSYHHIRIQVGIICSLLFFIAATNLEIKQQTTTHRLNPKQFTSDSLIQPPITLPPKIPVYITPSVFIEVPPEIIIDDPIMEFPDFDNGAAIPPLPPKEKEEETDIFETYGLEFLPKMRGGLPSLYKEIKYPEIARRTGIEGRVHVQFIVNKEGKVENPIILRGIGGGCDEEVLRVIRLMTFTPGIQNGNFVKVRMAQSVNFKLKN